MEVMLTAACSQPSAIAWVTLGHELGLLPMPIAVLARARARLFWEVEPAV
jgi:hypothetical protein